MSTARPERRAARDARIVRGMRTGRFAGSCGSHARSRSAGQLSGQRLEPGRAGVGALHPLELFGQDRQEQDRQEQATEAANILPPYAL